MTWRVTLLRQLLTHDVLNNTTPRSCYEACVPIALSLILESLGRFLAKEAQHHLTMEKRSAEAQDIKRPEALPTEITPLTPGEYAMAEKKLLRKIDLRIMPCLFLVIVLK